MIRYYSASKVYCLDRPVLDNGVIAVNEEGEIIEIYTPDKAKGLADIQVFEGVIVPGFVNVHCHLELSHMINKIPRHTGLVNFIKGVLAGRNETSSASESQIAKTESADPKLQEERKQQAMRAADKRMFERGIVAVGDISNTTDSKAVKLSSQIYYHTFVEILGFNREAGPVFENGLAIQKTFEPLPSTVVAHAPYSVNADLLKLIYKQEIAGQPLTIHNQETASENTLFTSASGEFASFLKQLGIALRSEQGQGKNSLEYHLPLAHKEAKLLLVHNTFTSATDMDFALATHPALYWALCPQANLYIENQLPDVELMRQKGLKLCFGTDSLASNQDLDILAEMKVIQSHFKVPLAEMLEWACQNGAAFLGLSDKIGSISPGKKPGLVWIKNIEGTQLRPESEAIRLV